MTKGESKGKTGAKRSSKPSRRSPGHMVCSKKRTILKNRIREIETRLLALSAHIATTELFLGIHESDSPLAVAGDPEGSSSKPRRGQAPAVQAANDLQEEE